MRTRSAIISGPIRSIASTAIRIETITNTIKFMEITTLVNEIENPASHAERAKEPPKRVSMGSEATLHLIIENVRDFAIFAQDTHGFIVSWNPGVERILGYAENEFVGMHVSAIFTPRDVRLGKVEREMAKAADDGKAEDLKCHVRRDGSLFWAAGLLMPLLDDDGKLTGFAKILRDNTRQKKHQQEREAVLRREREARIQAELLRKEVEQAEKAKDDFLALLAHELRNPLNAILGWVKILQSGKTDDLLMAKALTVIEENARSQNRLIEDVFDIARIRSGNLYLNLQAISLDDAVEGAVESLRPEAAAKNLALETYFTSEAVIINGDAGRMQQVVTNILSNSIKFTPAEGKIRVSLKCSAEHAYIVVEDTGQGISAELFPHLFDRYAQANKESKRGKSGLGLGLPLVHKLVEQHFGEVTVESAGEGLGTRFTVRLPLISAR
ncbi:MAG: PAS domain-containing sensor histidine kinase [Acidobacteriota bacterium]